MTGRIRASIVLNRPPEPEDVEVINMIGLCKAFGCLPRPGGLLEQDSLVVHLMQVVLAAQEEAEEREAERQRRNAPKFPGAMAHSPRTR